MAKVSWSYSALSSFETCPWRHYLTKVTKQVKDPPGEEAKWGMWVHEMLAKRVEHGTPLPVSIAGYEPMCAALSRSKTGLLLVERKLAINDKFEPVDWRSSDAWLRSIMDLAILNGPKGLMVDYKTGKYKPDNDQLELFAAVGFCHFPQLEEVKTSFFWLKDGTTENAVHLRGGVHATWAKFIPRVRKIEIAVETNDWPKKPSGLCKKHCPVGRGLCEHWGG